MCIRDSVYYHCCALIRARIMYCCISIREEGNSLPEGTATAAAQQSRLSQGDRQQKGNCCFGFISPRTAVTHDSIHDSIHETAATPSVSLAAVVTRTLLCVCVFSKTMYLDRQRYTVFWPYTVCRPHTKTNITRTHAHTRRVFFGDVASRNSLRSNKI